MQNSIAVAVRRNVFNSRELYRLMQYLTVVLILLLICFSSLALADDSSRAWEVKWYELRPKADGGYMNVFLSSENWMDTNFHYHWGTHRIYENYTNNLQFTATTLVYGDGDVHTIELYDVDDMAWVTIAGDEVLRVEMTGDVPASGAAEVTIPEGGHLLRVYWREECCSASVGFRMPEELYTPAGEGENQAPGFTGAVLTAAIVFYLLWRTKETHM